jgi:L-ribulokinase
MFAAVAAGPIAGGYATIVEASQHMARLGEDEYLPAEESAPVYDDLFGVYRELHDRYAEESSEMRRLRSIQARARGLASARVPA